MKLEHPKLVRLIQFAYSAEKAASFAYIGHAKSVKDPEAKKAIRRIELDEWEHRDEVFKLMQQYDIPVSKWLEFKFHVIGKLIAASCFVIGRFMPFYFAGSLESGNVCEYFRMKQYFNGLGIREHDEILYEMGMKEKDHEIYFLEQIKDDKLLPIFEKYFSWGNKSFNNVDLDKRYPVEESDHYCKSE